MKHRIFLVGVFLCLSAADYIPSAYLRAAEACPGMNYELLQKYLQNLQLELLAARAQAYGSYEQYRLNAPQVSSIDTRDFCPSLHPDCVSLSQGLLDFVIPIMRHKIFSKLEEDVPAKSQEYKSLYALCKLRENRFIMRPEMVMSYSRFQKIQISNQIYSSSLGLDHLVMSLSTKHLAALLNAALMSSAKGLLLGDLQFTQYWSIITYFENILSNNSDQCALVKLTTTIVPPEQFEKPSRLDFQVAYRNYIWKIGQEYAKQAGMTFPVNIVPHEDSLKDDTLYLNVSHQQLHPGAIAVVIKLLVLLDAIQNDSMWELKLRIVSFLESMERTCIECAQNLLSSRRLQREMHFCTTSVFFYTVKSNPRMSPVVISSVSKSSNNRNILAFHISKSLKISVMEAWLNKVQTLEETTIAHGDLKDLLRQILDMLPAKILHFN